MVKVALWVQLEAKPGKEQELANFLNSALSLVEQEPATVMWFALRVGATTFSIFDAFLNEEGRQSHLSGAVADALSKATDLFATPPQIMKLDVLAAMLPITKSKMTTTSI
jgi:quinol monooxygenase YgiN